MAPLKRKRAQDAAPAAPIPAQEATTRRATRQTSAAPLPMQLDPEPRKRRRRANTKEEEDAAAPSRLSKTARPTSPGTRGKENIPAAPTKEPDPLKQARPSTRNGAPAMASRTVENSPQKDTLPADPNTKQLALPHQSPAIPRRPNNASEPQPVRVHHKTGITKPLTVTTSGPKSLPQPKPVPPPQSPSSASPARPRAAAIPSTDRNIDKVVLGDICFRAWYPSYYPKELLGDLSSPSTSAHPPHHTHHNGSGSGSKDGAKGHARHREPPPILDRLCVCPCCFKYSKELVSWWEHVRICEARGHIPGRKIYTHPKGQRTVLVPAPGTAAGPKTMRGGKRGSFAAKMVEEVVRDEGEWSIWEVDGEKEGLFCQNLSLFAKLFLDNKSVFFDVTGFNYFLLVYTPPTPPPQPSPSAAGADALPPDSSVPVRQHVVGFFSKEKLSWDNNNLACILIFPPWQRKGLGSLLMGISYEISRREGVLGGPEKPISDLGKKGYKRFWGGEVARWLLGLEVEPGGEDKVVDVEACSRGTWIAVEDCLAVLRDMGVVEDAGQRVDPRKAGEKDGDETEGEEARQVKMVDMVKVDKEAVRRWVVSNGISLERSCDPEGFVDGYALKAEEEEDED